jgi:hypothetical protein
MLALLGIVFTAIATNVFSLFVLALGMALAAGGTWPELRPRLSRVWAALRVSGGAMALRFAAAMQSRRESRAAAIAASTWPAIGDYSVEVVGESMYQSPLTLAARGKATGPLGIPCKAQLVCEPTNPADGNAVAVFMKSQKVGYLSRPNARAFRKRLSETGKPLRTTTCCAIIRGGGTRDDGEQMFYGVWLDLEPL